MVAPGSANRNADYPALMYILFGLMVVSGMVLTIRGYSRDTPNG